MKCFISVCSCSTTNGHSWEILRFTLFYLLRFPDCLSSFTCPWQFFYLLIWLNETTSISSCVAMCDCLLYRPERVTGSSWGLTEVWWTLTALAAPHHQVGQLLHLETEPNQNDSFKCFLHFSKSQWMNVHVQKHTGENTGLFNRQSVKSNVYHSVYSNSPG